MDAEQADLLIEMLMWAGLAVSFALGVIAGQQR